MENKTKLKALFIVPSVVGILIFMIPVKFNGGWTIIVKIISDLIGGFLGGFLPYLVLGILTISAIMSTIALGNPKFIINNKLLEDSFVTSPIWVFIRVLGAVFCWITMFVSDEKNPLYLIASPDQGGFILNDLLCTLVITFAMAGLLLPLLLDFGLLEFIGALLTKLMRPLFNVPGRAAVDCITSWIGDGTLGVMLTCNQYERGYYSAREASIISTTFSAVSITFSLVVLDQVGLVDYFGIYYLTICLIGFTCALVCTRIPPLRLKKDTYLVEGNRMPEAIPEGFANSRAYGMDLAMRRVQKHKGIAEFLENGTKNMASMWFGVLPTVMSIGTVALMVANTTPIFEYMGIPFRPLLAMLQVPDVNAAASTMIIGFVDMFTPSILISGAGVCAMTKFIVAVVSVTQVIYLSEIGGLIMASKLPVNLIELFVIFLERTIISLLIVCPIAHIIF